MKSKGTVDQLIPYKVLGALRAIAIKRGQRTLVGLRLLPTQLKLDLQQNAPLLLLVEGSLLSLPVRVLRVVRYYN